jgi:hypothetical protein
MSNDTLPKVYIGGADWNGDVAMWAVAEDGEALAQHICSNRSYGRFDLHDRRRDVYEAKFGGFGDGVHYQLVEVHTWSDVPQEVRDANAARGKPDEPGTD